MFNVDAYKKSYKNFIDYLNGYSNSLLSKIGECDKNIALCDVLGKIKQTKDIKTIIDNKDFIISLNPGVNRYFKIIDFFMKNDALDAEQVSSAVESLLSIDEIKNYEVTKKNIFENKSSFESELSKVRTIISGNDYDIDFFNSLLLSSSLSDSDKISILSGLAYESSVAKSNTKSNSEEKSKSDKKDTKFKAKTDLVSVDKLNLKYNELTKKLDDYKRKLYSLFQNKTKKQLEYAANIAKLYNSGQIEFDVLNRNFTNDRMLVLLFSCSEYQETIKVCLDKAEDNKLNMVDYDEVSYYINEMESKLDAISKYYELELSRNKPVEVNYDDGVRTIFLLDKDGNPVIDFDKFNADELGKVNSLLDKCEKKNKSEKSIFLHNISNVDFDVLVGRFSSLICSYVYLENGSILVLNLGSKQKGFEETEKILSKNLDTVKSIREESKTMSSYDMYSTQSEYRDSIRDNYGINVSKPEEVKL